MVLANSDDDDPGLVGERLIERGFTLTIAYRDKGDSLSLDGVDLLVLLGSDWSVYWSEIAAHVEREVGLVRAAVASDTPMLGICYGGQIMSHALGGSVERSDIVEIGWFDVSSTSPALVPSGRWFEYHVDTFTAPHEATVLASTGAGPQAYRMGRALALQFHPEVTPEIVRRWGAGGTNDAERYGVDFEAVFALSDQLAQSNRRRCHTLVDAFLDEIAFPSVTR
jgi:GMP synthase-like glutamine amidotransferase